MAAIEKIIIVTKKTALEELVLRLNSREQARFYLEHSGVSFDDYERADAQYQHALHSVMKQLPAGLKQQRIDRDLLPTFQFGSQDLVLTLGPDGLVINVAKYLQQQPILAVNPDPQRIDGILIPFQLEETATAIQKAIKGHMSVSTISMAQVQLNDGQELYAINDLFIGTHSHGSARYTIELGRQHERHSSSGIIISTGAGCTGWLRSITSGAWQVARFFGAEGDGPQLKDIQLGWASDTLWYSVREPFPSNTSQTSLVFGQIGPGENMRLTSHMPEGGVIFSDGIESDFLRFNAGSIATVQLAARKAHLLRR